MTNTTTRHVAVTAFALLLGLMALISISEKLVNDLFKIKGVHFNSVPEQTGNQIDAILTNPTLGNKMVSDNTVVAGFNSVANVSQTYHLAEMPAGSLPNDIAYQNIKTFMGQACSIVATSQNSGSVSGQDIKVKVQNFNGKTYVGCVHS